jgi:hypothetical protein
MRGHVTDDEVLDLAEGGGAEAARAHAEGCLTCSSRVGEARAALDVAVRADVPEPPPLYWETLRRDVGRRIAEDRRRPPRWAWLAPLAAAAAVGVIALSTGRPHAPPSGTATTLAAWSALPDAEEDPSLPVLEAVLEEDPAAFDEAAGVAAFLASLSEDESRALADSLRRSGLGGES